MLDPCLRTLWTTRGELAQVKAWLDAHPVEPSALLGEIRDAILDLLDTGAVEQVEVAVACAWAIAQLAAEPEATALAHWCNGLALLNRATRPALDHLDAAYAYFAAQDRRAEQGRLLIGRAGLLGQLGQLEAAHAAISAAAAYLAEAPAYHNRLPALAINRSDIEGRMGQYAAMLATAREAESLAERYQQPAAHAEALINQAFAALFLGQFSLAETTLARAAVVAEGCGSVELRARVAVNQARLATYRGDLFAALRLLAQARTNFAAARIEQDQATVALEEAVLFERLQLLSEARRAAVQAATLFEQAGLLQESVEANLTAVRLALSLGQIALARQDLARAVSVATRTALSPVLRALLQGYTAHPRFQRAAAERRRALDQVEAARDMLAASGVLAEQLELALFAADLTRNPKLAGKRYHGVAEAARAHGLVDLEQRALVGLAQRLPASAACAPLRRAADLVAATRQMMPIEELKARYLTGHAPLYVTLINAYLQAERIEEAVQSVLEAKGAIWTELAAPDAATNAARLIQSPDWLQAKAEWDYWRAQMHTTRDPSCQDRCAERMKQAELTLQRLARQHLRRRPAQTLPTGAAIQACLSPASVGVEYLVADDEIKAFLFTADAPARPLSIAPVRQVTQLLSRLTLQYRALGQCASDDQQQRLARNQLPACERVLNELYRLLIAPIITACGSAVTQVIIAPDGALYSVPWCALRDPAQSDAGYLDQRFDLHLMPSLALLALPSAPEAAGAPLLLGWEGQPALTHVATELMAIKRHIPSARLIHPARLSDLRWETPPSLLHLAVHGLVNPSAPLLSQLRLADGALLLADVLSLPLAGTALVTLSACESGATPERGGVALALAGAFLSAGARAVVASLWPVHDQATSFMMEQFYRGLAAGQRLSQALSAARAELRANGRQHPYYWAAFQPLSRDGIFVNARRDIALLKA